MQVPLSDLHSIYEHAPPLSHCIPKDTQGFSTPSTPSPYISVVGHSLIPSQELFLANHIHIYFFLLFCSYCSQSVWGTVYEVILFLKPKQKTRENILHLKGSRLPGKISQRKIKIHHFSISSLPNHPMC